MKYKRKILMSLFIICVMVVSSFSQIPVIYVDAAESVTVRYQTHIQSYGWEGDDKNLNTWKKDGEMSGTSGKSKRLEGIKIIIPGNAYLGIQYTTHCQTYGWLPWSSDGEMNGTEGEAKRLEAIKIKLTGTDASRYDVYYRVHAQSYGWLSWAKNGQAAGTAGLSKRLEGIQVVVVPRGTEVPNEYQGITATNDKPYISASDAIDEDVPGADKTNVLYKTHVQTYGWQGWKSNGRMSGTSGMAKRLEGINIKLTNNQYGGGILYRTHVQTYGWQSWAYNGAMSGTSGEAKRLEAIQIYLSGDIGKYFDVYYRVHAQTYGWLNWVKNGEPAGTAGYGKRLEGIQIIIVEKNSGVPGDVDGIKSVSDTGFIYSSVSQVPENPYLSSIDNPDGKKDITEYTYKVTPLTNDVCSYFYVETENPDPYSFIFIDEDNSSITKYLEHDYKANFFISEEFPDVKYINKDTLRVNGGYIFKSHYTDGGKLRLYKYSLSTVAYPTDITVTIPKLKTKEQYLIDTYTKEDMNFWEKMNALDGGLSTQSMYRGTITLGDFHKDMVYSYYGISNSPHVDQNFYIQSPYYYDDNEAMLVTCLYPYILNSVEYPTMLATLAKRLDPSVECKENPDFHWLVDITYNGETRSYGGDGSLKGNAINKDMIKYWYSFDGAPNDVSKKSTWEDLWNIHEDYANMIVPEAEKDLPKLTWIDIKNAVGTEGSYVKIAAFKDSINSANEGYAYIYDDGTDRDCGFISNAWYDGRFFNRHEIFEKGTTIKDENASTANIIIKNPVIPLPEKNDEMLIEYDYEDIKNVEQYDVTTGVWKGFVYYRYNKDTQTWVATIYDKFRYYDKNVGKYREIDDEEFVDACTLTLEEVKAMGIDRNANLDPSSYLNYNMKVEPGTPGTN